MTEADFDRFAWHDCHLWGIELRVGEPAEHDWTSELVLRIDYIVEWMCDVDGRGGQFRVAPAELVFHDVTDPRIAIDWRHGDARTAIHPASIDRIEREPERDRTSADRAEPGGVGTSGDIAAGVGAGGETAGGVIAGDADPRAAGRPARYRWRIVMNSPAGGEVAFGATGYTQTLLGEPLLVADRQHLTRGERAQAMARS